MTLNPSLLDKKKVLRSWRFHALVCANRAQMHPILNTYIHMYTYVYDFRAGLKEPFGRVLLLNDMKTISLITYMYKETTIACNSIYLSRFSINVIKSLPALPLYSYGRWHKINVTFLWLPFSQNYWVPRDSVGNVWAQRSRLAARLTAPTPR